MAEGAVDTRMVSESAVLDAMLLGECDFFVGRWRTVQLTRAAYPLTRLAFAALPATSLDWRWS